MNQCFFKKEKVSYQATRRQGRKQSQSERATWFQLWNVLEKADLLRQKKASEGREEERGKQVEDRGCSAIRQTPKNFATLKQLIVLNHNISILVHQVKSICHTNIKCSLNNKENCGGEQGMWEPSGPYAQLSCELKTTLKAYSFRKLSLPSKCLLSFTLLSTSHPLLKRSSDEIHR